MLTRLKQVNFAKLISVLFFIALLYLLQLSYFNLKNWLTDEKSVPLSALILTGDNTHITFNNVRDVLINQEDRLNFFTVEIAQIQKELEDMPWVYSVSIRKRWPDTLKVHIVEQSIVAVWNDRALLNRFGEIVQADPVTAKQDYVSLHGNDEQANDVLTTYMKLHQLLKVNDFEIASLSSDTRQSTSLTLKNGMLLRLGKEQKLDRIQTFLTVYPLIGKKYDVNKIDYIDLRYDTGFAIGWKGESELIK
ncbi:cell division protein FtsQ [Psychromonas sp. psych-6C06]|uniref:cell division protein FtsQ/DivIB n=1 Tax=Psychromonas sp. psych-6C06 TaxID=2058089 RepID=UPI000C3360CD|nr:cell division protein FtsQ/DivIB [Psychromonas sp. psych-6C06]PKF62233.1 cell division protein FtsQ [Psychromonas sp. psych-6C06]